MRKASVVVAVLTLRSIAGAEPMISTLDDVVARSPDIVIATYTGPASTADLSPSKLRVERALRGTLSGDIVAPIGSGRASVKPGTRVVAFLDTRHAWSYVGEALGTLGLDDVMAVRGFYDFNAHLVTPGVITIAQLRDKIAKRPITWRLEGPLVGLADDGSRVVDSPWQIRVDAPERGAAAVAGLPTTKGLPAPSVSVGGGQPSVTIQWRTSWPRPLVIHGTITGRRGDVLLAQFHVEQPDLLRVADIANYLADANASYVLYRMRIVWSDGTVWPVLGGADYTSLRVSDEHDREIRWGEFDMRNHRHIGAIELGAARPGALLDERGDTRVLVQEILRGPIAVSYGARKGRLELVGITMPPPVRAP